MKIYTKLGDQGETSLIGGKRVLKSHLRIEAYGSVDELIAHLAVVRDSDISDEHKEFLIDIQHILMDCTAILAAESKMKDYNFPKISLREINKLEAEIDRLENTLPVLHSFIIPGGHITASYCNVARNVCRRAERVIVETTKNFNVNPNLVKFINRLSDYLFVLSRKILQDKGINEILWKK